MSSNAIIRKQLLSLLRDPIAHATFEHAIADCTMPIINETVKGFNHSLWDLLEHLRIAQWDILDFIRNPIYKEKSWPNDYWPAKEQKADKEMWDHSVAGFRNDLAEFEAMLNDDKIDLFAPLPHAPKYTIFREILVLADHNAYHVGQMVVLRQQLGDWGSN